MDCTIRCLKIPLYSYVLKHLAAVLTHLNPKACIQKSNLFSRVAETVGERESQLKIREGGAFKSYDRTIKSGD